MDCSNGFDVHEITPVNSLLSGFITDQNAINPSPLTNSITENGKITPLPSYTTNSFNGNLSDSNVLRVTSSALPSLPSIPTSNIERIDSTFSFNNSNLQQIQPTTSNNSFMLLNPEANANANINTIARPNPETDIILFSSNQQPSPPPPSPLSSSVQDFDTSPIQRTRPINFCDVKVEMVKCSWCSKKHPARLNKKGKPVKLCIKCSEKKKEYRVRKHGK